MVGSYPPDLFLAQVIIRLVGRRDASRYRKSLPTIGPPHRTSARSLKSPNTQLELRSGFTQDIYQVERGAMGCQGLIACTRFLAIANTGLHWIAATWAMVLNFRPVSARGLAKTGKPVGEAVFRASAIDGRLENLFGSLSDAISIPRSAAARHQTMHRDLDITPSNEHQTMIGILERERGRQGDLERSPIVSSATSDSRPALAGSFRQ